MILLSANGIEAQTRQAMGGTESFMLNNLFKWKFNEEEKLRYD